MHIGINGERLLIDKLAGPEVYTYNIINALACIDTKNVYTIYFNRLPSVDFFKKLTNSNPNFNYKVLPKVLSWTQISLALELLVHRIDVFFTAVHTLPIFRHPKTKFVSLIHGLEYTYSKEYANPLLRWFVSGPIWYTAKFSDAIIVPSQYTKNALSEKRWADNKTINIIPEGVNAIFYKRPETEIRQIREKYDLGDFPYLLFVSTVQPRKNIPAMIKAFSLALKELKCKDTKLLLSGKLGWLYEESLDAPKKYNIEKNVIFLGRTDDEDLPILLSGASSFINLSLEEGFGLPLLEALACEVPCIVSDIPAFREIGCDVPFYVNPNNVDAIKNTIVSVLNGPVDSERLKKEKTRANEFTWEKAAKKTLQVIEG